MQMPPWQLIAWAPFPWIGAMLLPYMHTRKSRPCTRVCVLLCGLMMLRAGPSMLITYTICKMLSAICPTLGLDVYSGALTRSYHHQYTLVQSLGRRSPPPPTIPCQLPPSVVSTVQLMQSRVQCLSYKSRAAGIHPSTFPSMYVPGFQQFADHAANRSVAKFSAIPAEEEALLPPNTQLQVCFFASKMWNWPYFVAMTAL